jgi:hypothetical protein
VRDILWSVALVVVTRILGFYLIGRCEREEAEQAMVSGPLGLTEVSQ